MKKIYSLLLALAALIPFTTHAQHWVGFQGSSYAGSQNLFYNPAEIVDSRYKADINLIGVGMNFSNNYVYMDRSALFGKNAFYKRSDSYDFQKEYLHTIDNAKDKSLNLNTTIYGPSFMFNFGKKHNNAIGFFTKFSLNVNADNISPELARIMWTGVKTPDLFGKTIDEKKLSINAMAYTEFGLSYGRILYDKGPHRISAAISPKILMGNVSLSLYSNNLQYNWKNSDTLSIYKSDVSYGHSANVDFGGGGTPTIKPFTSKPSFAVDLGVVYEWRPNADKYTYDMDCKTGIGRRDRDKYKIKAGFSIMDIGAIKWEKDYTSDNFYADINEWKVKGFKFSGIQSIDDSINSRFVYKNAKSSYNQWLPLKINFFVDYNIWKGFHATFSGNIMPKFNNASQVHGLSYFTITPRYDHAWFGAALPVTFDLHNNVNWGVNLRLGPLWIGTSDITPLIGKKKIKGADIYFALHIPIPNHLPRDKDKDKMSNKMDKCKKEPGPCATGGCPDKDNDGVVDKEDACPDVAGVKELGGCPDKDGDKIIDKDDDCPDVPGLKEFKGCPDTDKDGIQDKDDKCPTQAGPKEFNGCPDTDKDGIADPDDKCPSVPGLKEFNGCPDSDKDGIQDAEDKCPDVPGLKQYAGCPDTDGDGLPDPDDQCPKVAGPISNKGCPEIKKEVIEKMKKAAAGIYFETNKAILKSVSYEALDKVVDTMKGDSTLNLDIEGHTDNVGKPDFNMALSERRAAVVLDYIVKKGVDPKRITSKGFGDTKPVADNSTSAGKAKNRRVELNLRNF